MVGDLLDDVEAGHRAGATGLLLDTGAETAWRRSPLREPAGVFSDWPSLAEHLLREAAAGTSVAMDAPLDEPMSRLSSTAMASSVTAQAQAPA